LPKHWRFESLREEVAMKAVQVVKYGDAVEGVELREVPEPDTPKPGEVLVGVEFSPINFNDLMVVWGVYSWKPELPGNPSCRRPWETRAPAK
jgi:NADPH:quinone reductase-like Zn-dependent oxidoreductase